MDDAGQAADVFRESKYARERNLKACVETEEASLHIPLWPPPSAPAAQLYNSNRTVCKRDVDICVNLRHAYLITDDYGNTLYDKIDPSIPRVNARMGIHYRDDYPERGSFGETGHRRYQYSTWTNLAQIAQRLARPPSLLAAFVRKELAEAYNAASSASKDKPMVPPTFFKYDPERLTVSVTNHGMRCRGYEKKRPLDLQLNHHMPSVLQRFCDTFVHCSNCGSLKTDLRLDGQCLHVSCGSCGGSTQVQKSHRHMRVYVWGVLTSKDLQHYRQLVEALIEVEDPQFALDLACGDKVPYLVNTCNGGFGVSDEGMQIWRNIQKYTGAWNKFVARHKEVREFTRNIEYDTVDIPAREGETEYAKNADEDSSGDANDTQIMSKDTKQVGEGADETAQQACSDDGSEGESESEADERYMVWDDDLRDDRDLILLAKLYPKYMNGPCAKLRTTWIPKNAYDIHAYHVTQHEYGSESLDINYAMVESHELRQRQAAVLHTLVRIAHSDGFADCEERLRSLRELVPCNLLEEDEGSAFERLATNCAYLPGIGDAFNEVASQQTTFMK